MNRLTGTSRTAAPVDDHTRQNSADDVFVRVEVKQRDGGEVTRGAARSSVPVVGPELLDDVRVRKALKVGEGTFAGAVIGVVASRGYNPVPTKRLEVDDERVSAAPALVASLLACHRRRRPTRTRSRSFSDTHV